MSQFNVGQPKTMKGYVYHSNTFFDLAVEAFNRTGTQTSEAYGAIIFSVIGFESFFNEFSRHCNRSFFPQIDQFPEKYIELGKALKDLESRNERLLTKVRMIWFAFTNKYPSIGDFPFQDLDYLIRIRNRLIHAKPQELRGENVGELMVQHPNFFQYFKDKSIISSEGNASKQSTISVIASPAMAEWSILTALKVIQETEKILPRGQIKTLIGQFLQANSEKMKKVQQKNGANIQ